jgi:LysR family transcriptional activator of nhaA
MIHLNYHHLYYFHVVAKMGSIAKACESLLLSQPTISLQLKGLEAQLSCKLFERQGRGLRLTEDGRFVQDYAESIFRLGQELTDSLKDRKPGGKVSVQLGVVAGTPRAFSHSLVEGALSLSRSAHAEMHEGTLDALIKDLLEHRLDLVLSDRVYSGKGREGLRFELAGRAPIVFAANAQLAKRCGATPQSLARVPWILPSAPAQVYVDVVNLLARWRIQPLIVAEVSDVEVARRLALAGRGITPLNAYTVSVSMPRGKLVTVGPKRSGISEPVYLIAAKRRWMNPVAAELLETYRLPKL